MNTKCAGRLKYGELVKYTDNFSKDNFLGTFQFGKVYRGKIEQFPHEIQHVMVKIWEVPELYVCFLGDNEARLMHEIGLFQRGTQMPFHNHPGMIELQGYCWDGEHLGAVYNFKPLDIVHNLIPKDSFTWFQRIKVAVGFASILKFLHSRNRGHEPFLICNISASHIVVDEEFNPKLYDLGMITGGFIRDRTVHTIYCLVGCIGYIDPCVQSGWTEKTDVFAFGAFLLYLITKRVLTEEERKSESRIYFWAWEHYKSSETDRSTKEPIYSFVNESLVGDPEFSYNDGRKLTKLAMNCTNDDPSLRPSMKEVLRRLLKLQIVKDHAESLGLLTKRASWFV